MSTLTTIRSNVRALTKMPSPNQLSDAAIDAYVNDFLLYDFPQAISVIDLKKNIPFTTTPYVDTYRTTTGAFTYNLKDFKDSIVSIDAPIFIGGRQVRLSQSQSEFYSLYPANKVEEVWETGDGIATAYSCTLPTPTRQGTIIIGSTDDNGAGITVYDKPILDDFGRDGLTGALYDQNDVVIGNVDYTTGAAVLVFTTVPGDGADITYELEQTTIGAPDTVLFFDNTFVLRPVPDAVYEVKVQANVLPTALVDAGDSPEIKQWSSYISYGAAKKVLEYKGNYDALQNILPEFYRQESLVEIRTIKMLDKEMPSVMGSPFSNNNNFWGE